MEMLIASDQAMREFGEVIGRILSGGEVIEMMGDVGAGKTTLTKGIALGLGIDETVQSPTFTISRQYDARDGLVLVHYDFYRLVDAGIMSDELRETVGLQDSVTVIEWSAIVAGVLPRDRVTVTIETVDEQTRKVAVTAGGDKSQSVLEKLA